MSLDRPHVEIPRDPSSAQLPTVVCQVHNSPTTLLPIQLQGVQISKVDCHVQVEVAFNL